MVDRSKSVYSYCMYRSQEGAPTTTVRVFLKVGARSNGRYHELCITSITSFMRYPKSTFALDLYVYHYPEIRTRQSAIRNPFNSLDPSTSLPIL